MHINAKYEYVIWKIVSLFGRDDIQIFSRIMFLCMICWHVVWILYENKIIWCIRYEHISYVYMILEYEMILILNFYLST